MLLDQVFERFVQERPVGVMVRSVLENALQPKPLDQLFKQLAQQQYTRELLFSQVVDLMSLVVGGIFPSPCAADQALQNRVTVSLTSVSNKLNGIEPAISAGLVRHVATQMEPLIRHLGGVRPELLPGNRVKILDGNCLARTEHRLKELRTTAAAGALPGKSLVVLDPAVMLALEVVPCEDGHTQERALLQEILPTVQPHDLWIEDRNLCTTAFVFGVAHRGGCFLVREHQTNVPWTARTELRSAGRGERADVWEQEVLVEHPETGERLVVRRVELRLDRRTRDGDRVISLLTNLAAGAASAVFLANLYRNRWTIETLFQVLTETLGCEQPTLGYPRAALFSFCVALVAYNVLAVVRAALGAAHGQEKVEEEVSSYYLADEIGRVYDGMMVALPPAQWTGIRGLKTSELAQLLKGLASHADLAIYRRHRRGPKKPQPPRSSAKDQPHVSTARLLANREKKPRSS